MWKSGFFIVLDAKVKRSRPTDVVPTTSRISEIFDSISYGKGAAIPRMLHTHIGHDAFLRALQKHLAHFAYRNANT